MRARILSLLGDRDAIRFGAVRILGPASRVLAYTYDRLSGAVSLHQSDAAELTMPRPASPEEVAAATVALHAAAPPMGAAA